MSESQESVGAILGNSFSKGSAPAATTDVSAPEKVDKTEATPSVVAETKVETTDKSQARDESGKFTSAPKVEEKAEKPRADVAAIIDERRKRQALEQKLREIEGARKEPKPSVFDDEDKAITSRIEEANRPLREAFYKLSLKAARSTHKDDFESAEQAFAEAAERDERLIEGLRSSDDPGEYIYSMGTHIRELADVGGDLGRYREKLTGSMKTQLEERDTQIKALMAEIETLKKAHVDLETVPRNLNSQSSGASPKAGEEDPEDIRLITRFGSNKQR